MKMKVIHIYHSCFVLQQDDIAIVIDYCEDPDNVLPHVLNQVKHLYVLSSHAHPDHFNSIVFRWSELCGDTIYLLSYDIKRKLKKHKKEELPETVIFLNKNAEYHDDNIQVLTFDSTDVGVSFLIEFCGYTFFHAGDLNNWRWEGESTEEEMLYADKSFNAILRKLKQKIVNGIDCAMFPVDPRMNGDFSLGARQFVNTLKVKYFIPMHTWGMWDKACDFDLYRNHKYGEYICLKSGECLNLE